MVVVNMGQVNNYIVRSYRVLIAATNIVIRKTNKTQIIVMY